MVISYPVSTVLSWLTVLVDGDAFITYFPFAVIMAPFFRLLEEVRKKITPPLRISPLYIIC